MKTFDPFKPVKIIETLAGKRSPWAILNQEKRFYLYHFKTGYYFGLKKRASIAEAIAEAIARDSDFRRAVKQ